MRSRREQIQTHLRYRYDTVYHQVSIVQPPSRMCHVLQQPKLKPQMHFCFSFVYIPVDKKRPYLETSWCWIEVTNNTNGFYWHLCLQIYGLEDTVLILWDIISILNLLHNWLQSHIWTASEYDFILHWFHIWGEQCSDWIHTARTMINKYISFLPMCLCCQRNTNQTTNLPVSIFCWATIIQSLLFPLHFVSYTIVLQNVRIPAVQSFPVMRNFETWAVFSRMLSSTFAVLL